MIELIDREATVKQICKMGEMLGVGHDRDVTIAVALFVQEDKSAFSTIEAYTFEQYQKINRNLKERPHGEWIFHKYDKDYECSNCHVRFDRTQIYTEKRFENALWAKMKIYNFCPNCGADMREGDIDG